MATYTFDVVTDGDWSDPKDWYNRSTNTVGGIPGAGDSAYIYADDETTKVATEGQSVKNVIGYGPGTEVLSGEGLNISDDLIGITLLSGAYYVGGVARDVTLDSGSLFGNAIGGTSSADGGARIEGGVVTSSNSFWGTVSGGATVHTKELLSGATQGSAGTIDADTTGSSCYISEEGGQFNFMSVSLGPGGGGIVEAGAFNDSGAFSLMGSASAMAGMTFSGGAEFVDGAANIGSYSFVNVLSKAYLTLKNGLTVGQTNGGVGALNVGAPGSPGGNLTVKAGSVIFGGQGTATAHVSMGGVLNALASNVIVAQQSSSKSTLFVTLGGILRAESLTVGKGGSGTLNIASAGWTAVTGALTVAADPNSTGAISMTGSGSKLRIAGAVSIGGTTTAVGGSGTITIGSGATATFGATTIWRRTGEIIDNGTLTFTGDVHGGGGGLVKLANLEIGDGAVVNMKGTASSMYIAFDGDGMLNLGYPSGFTADITGISDGGSIKVAGFQGADELFRENKEQTAGTAYLIGSTELQIHFLGNYNSADFQWNKATGTLEFT